jgi:hypothetical protein
MICGSSTAIGYHDADSTDTYYHDSEAAVYYLRQCREIMEMIESDDIEWRPWILFRGKEKAPREIKAVMSHIPKSRFHRKMGDSRSGMKGTTIKRRLGKL